MLHHQACPLGYQRRNSARIRNQHRRAAGNGLRGRIAEVFIHRWQHEQVRVAVSGPFGFTVQWSRKQDSPFNPIFAAVSSR